MILILNVEMFLQFTLRYVSLVIGHGVERHY